MVEGFLPVAAPASVIPDRKNEYYKSDEDLAEAIGQAMHVEYKQIVDNGLLVQLDDARAAVTYDRMVPPASFQDYRKRVRLYQDVLNRATEGIPTEKIRYHVCWGSWPGPHTTDVPIKDIMDLILRVRAGAYVLEMANPRHEHEWQVWKDVKLPKGSVLIPGVISHATNVVEHPELVKRAHRAAGQAGRPRERHRRHRLRLRAAAVLPARPPDASNGRSCRRWSRARGLPARNCGAGAKKAAKKARRKRRSRKNALLKEARGLTSLAHPGARRSARTRNPQSA